MISQVTPQTRYAQNGTVSIAWSATGDSPLDLLFAPGLTSHVEHLWEGPTVDGFLRNLTRFARLILMDRRGTGLSDPLQGPIGLDEEIGDVDAILDSAGSEQVVMMGYAAGAPLCIHYAYRRPERVRALVLYAPLARLFSAPGYDWTYDEEERREAFERWIERWGTGDNVARMAPSAADDPRMRAWLGRLERLSSSPGGMRQLVEYYGAQDVRDDLAAIRVPTLIMHRNGDRMIDVRHSRYLAEHIPGARYVELDGIDSLPSVGDQAALLGEIEEFLTGGRRRTVRRAMLTVLITDICDSTGHAARLGDAAWRELLQAHDTAVRHEIDRFEGREVKTIGDGFLITFTGAPSSALECARSIVTEARQIGLEVRVGVHTGECEILGDDVGGMAVHIAARVAALAGSGEVLASGTAFGTVVGSGLRFESRGSQALKGVPGQWPLFALLD